MPTRNQLSAKYRWLEPAKARKQKTAPAEEFQTPIKLAPWSDALPVFWSQYRREERTSLAVVDGSGLRMPKFVGCYRKAINVPKFPLELEWVRSAAIETNEQYYDIYCP